MRNTLVRMLTDSYILIAINLWMWVPLLSSLNSIQAKPITHWLRKIHTLYHHTGSSHLLHSVLKSSRYIFIEICYRWMSPQIEKENDILPHTGASHLLAMMLESSCCIFFKFWCRWTSPYTETENNWFPHRDSYRLLVQCSRVPIESSFNCVQANASTYWYRYLQIPTQRQLSLVGSVLKSSSLIFIQFWCTRTHPHTDVDIVRFPHTGVSRLFVQCWRVPVVSSFNSVQANVSTYYCRYWQIVTHWCFLVVRSVLKASSCIFFEFNCRLTSVHGIVDTWKENKLSNAVMKDIVPKHFHKLLTGRLLSVERAGDYLQQVSTKIRE